MQKKLKVLWIIPSKKDSPLDLLFAKRGIPFLTQHGIEIEIWNFYESKSFTGIFKEARKLKSHVETNQIDLLHAQFGSTTALLTYLVGKPYVVTFRGTDVNGDPGSSILPNLLRKSLSYFSAHFATAIVCVSSKLREKIGPAWNKAVVIPSGTKAELMMPIPKQEAKAALNLDQNTHYLAFASGGRRRVKRYDIALEVVKKLKEKGLKCELLEIWDIPHDKVPLYLNASDVVILTSEREGSPNIVREGLACGVPIVAFNVGDASEWINLDTESSVIPFGDTEAMVQKVDNAIRRNPARTRRVDIELFSETNSAKRLLEIYNKLH